MRYRRDGRRYVLKLEPGDEVTATLLAFAREEGLPGAFLRGIGAVNRARIGYFRPERRAYDERILTENLEVVALVGNLAWRGEDPILHAHVSLGRSDFSLVGGHLFEATVSVTLELRVDPTDGRLEREADSRFDLNLLGL